MEGCPCNGGAVSFCGGFHQADREKAQAIAYKNSSMASDRRGKINKKKKERPMVGLESVAV